MAPALLDRVPASLRTLAKRTALRLGVDVTGNPFHRRIARLCAARGLTTVVDVGASTGEYAALLRQRGFRGAIVSCEPLAGPYRELCRAGSGDPLWRAERVALGAREGTVEVNVAGNSHSSSVLPMLPAHSDAAPESRYVRTETAPMSTVDDVLERNGVDPARSLLKIDVQGFEWEVLSGAARTLPELAAAQVELSLVPLYGGQRLMDELTARLAAAGLVLWSIEPGFCDPATGRMLQCDGLFVRDPA